MDASSVIKSAWEFWGTWWDNPVWGYGVATTACIIFAFFVGIILFEYAKSYRNFLEGHGGETDIVDFLFGNLSGGAIGEFFWVVVIWLGICLAWPVIAPVAAIFMIIGIFLLTIKLIDTWLLKPFIIWRAGGIGIFLTSDKKNVREEVKKYTRSE